MHRHRQVGKAIDRNIIRDISRSIHCRRGGGIGIGRGLGKDNGKGGRFLVKQTSQQQPQQQARTKWAKVRTPSWFGFG